MYVCNEINNTLNMKTFKFIGLALAAILMGMSLSSCNKEDSSENEGAEDLANEKKIVKFVESWGSDEELEVESSFTFKYDDKGRLVEVISSESGLQFSYAWGDNLISRARPENSKVDNITLNNGLVTSHNIYDGNLTYTYNKSNRLVAADGRHYKLDFVWDNDKLVRISYDDAYQDIVYEGTCKKGYCPTISYIINDQEYLYFLNILQPDCVGLRTNKLPKYSVYHGDDGDTDTETYAYEFDKDGYISKLTVTFEDGDVCVQEYTWK